MLIRTLKKNKGQKIHQICKQNKIVAVIIN